ERPRGYRSLGQYVGAGRRRRARLDAQLREDPLEMLAHRARARAKDGADVLVRLPFADPVEDLGLTLGQAQLLERGVVGLGVVLFEHQEIVRRVGNQPDVEPRTLAHQDKWFWRLSQRTVAQAHRLGPDPAVEIFG